MKTVTAFNATDFREWLKEFHDSESKVSVVVFKKHSGKPFPSHKELMFEAICFGWIDTTVKRLDEDRFIRTFSKRNKNSKWSNNTLRYAKELVEQGRMTPVGLKFYEEGLKKPTHDFGIPINPSMPIELKTALNKSKKAKANFDKFTPSAKKTIYRWILRAKRPETKTKRTTTIVNGAKNGVNAVFQTRTTKKNKKLKLIQIPINELNSNEWICFCTTRSQLLIHPIPSEAR